jgi:glycosyltransferase involved in cell wall biosynthesis
VNGLHDADHAGRASRTGSGARAVVVPANAGLRWLLPRVLGPPRAKVIHFDSLRSAARLAGRARFPGGALVASTGAVELFDAGPDDAELRDLWSRLDGLLLPDLELLERARRLGCPDRIAVRAIPPTPQPAPPTTPVARRGVDDEIRACSIANLHWTSGFEYAIHAIALLRARGVQARLTLVGSGALLDVLMYYRAVLDLRAEVEFVLDIGGSEAIEALHTANVYLHPSTVPGLTPGLLAAASWKLPVLATDGGRLVRTIACGDRSADPIPRRDAPALAEALERLAADLGLARRLGGSAQDRTAPLLGDDARVAALRGLYEDAVSVRSVQGKKVR